MGQETKIPTGYKIEKSLWDCKAKLPKKNPLRTIIGNIKSDLENRLQIVLGMGGELSLQLVKDYFGDTMKVKPENVLFYYYYLEFVKEKVIAGKDTDTIRINKNIYVMLKEFAIMAGINKTISCQVACNTFGTLQILAGTDITIVKTLFGHSKITSTMVYFNDSKKLVDDYAKKS